MRCVIEDKATPKTGGVTNRAQPTAASRFELGISNFGLVSDFEIRLSDFPRPVGAYYAKQTQKESPAPGGPPVFNRSLSRFIGSLSAGDPHTNQKCETNPIYRLATRPYSQMRKTNPIYPCPSLAHDPKMRNEPNLPLPQPGPRPNYAKRTQFTPWRAMAAFSLRRGRSAVQ